jgi:hypothetical protein
MDCGRGIRGCAEEEPWVNVMSQTDSCDASATKPGTAIVIGRIPCNRTYEGCPSCIAYDYLVQQQ